MNPKQASYGSKPTSGANPSTIKGKPNVAAGKGTARNMTVGQNMQTKHVATGTTHGKHDVSHAIKTASGPTVSKISPNC